MLSRQRELKIFAFSSCKLKFPPYILNDFDQIKWLHNYSTAFTIKQLSCFSNTDFTIFSKLRSHFCNKDVVNEAIMKEMQMKQRTISIYLRHFSFNAIHSIKVLFYRKLKNLLPFSSFRYLYFMSNSKADSWVEVYWGEFPFVSFV